MSDKITFIRQRPGAIGGAEAYLQRLCRELDRQGRAWEVASNPAPRWLPGWIRTAWFAAWVCRRKQNRFYFSLERVPCADIYRAGDGVHKVFLRSKGFTLNPLHAVVLWLERQCFAQTRLIIANSAMVRDQIHAEYQVPLDRIQVIRNGVPTPPAFDATAARHRLAAKYGHDPKLPVVLFVGNGFARKGVRELLATVRQVAPPLVTLIVGRDKHQARYVEQARAIPHPVIFSGEQRENLSDYYAAADIFLFPTRYEPFSNVVLEAMSYRCAVITTSANGAAEVLPEDCVLDTPDAAAAQLTTWLRDPTKLREAQQRNAAVAAEHTPEQNLREVLTALAQARAEAATARP